MGGVSVAEEIEWAAWSPDLAQHRIIRGEIGAVQRGIETGWASLSFVFFVQITVWRIIWFISSLFQCVMVNRSTWRIFDLLTLLLLTFGNKIFQDYDSFSYVEAWLKRIVGRICFSFFFLRIVKLLITLKIRNDIFIIKKNCENDESQW